MKGKVPQNCSSLPEQPFGYSRSQPSFGCQLQKTLTESNINSVILHELLSYQFIVRSSPLLRIDEGGPCLLCKQIIFCSVEDIRSNV